MPNELDENTRKRIEAEAEKAHEEAEYVGNLYPVGYRKGATAEALRSKKLVEALENTNEVFNYLLMFLSSKKDLKQIQAAKDKAEQALNEYNGK